MLRHLSRSLGESRHVVRRMDGLVVVRLDTVRSPALDGIMAAVSGLADASRLWIATAAWLALLGGVGGRRAAIRGLASLGLTSAVVNIPLKIFWQRPRPEAVTVGRVRPPTSYSFPSGHTASAFAFATGVGLEMPSLLLPLLLSAGAVGCSRVYVRVHYPSDVIAGALLGVAIGAASRSLVGLLERPWKVPA